MPVLGLVLTTTSGSGWTSFLRTLSNKDVGMLNSLGFSKDKLFSWFSNKIPYFSF